jgi:hypothetical protein
VEDVLRPGELPTHQCRPRARTEDLGEHADQLDVVAAGATSTDISGPGSRRDGRHATARSAAPGAPADVQLASRCREETLRSPKASTTRSRSTARYRCSPTVPGWRSSARSRAY